jgi:predicted AAA+ superfamily ATPase
MEKRPELTFVLTGSSARKLKAQSADLLGGRALDLRIHPFMAAELGDRFDLTDALRYGLVPVIWGRKEREVRLKSYISLYLQMEVEMERLVRNIQTFTSFLKAASFSHGSLVNCANIARECGATPGTVASYFDLVDDLMLGFRLSVFAKRAKRELVSSQKFYYFDSGVFGALRPKGPLDSPSELFGPALEGLVAQHLRAWNQYRRQDISLSFWRSRGGVEVDFVVYGENVFTAIEVKNSTRIDSKDLAPLKEFASDYPESTQVLLYGGTQKLRKGSIWCIPAADFLRKLHPAKEMAEVIEA